MKPLRLFEKVILIQVGLFSSSEERGRASESPLYKFQIPRAKATKITQNILTSGNKRRHIVEFFGEIQIFLKEDIKRKILGSQEAG